MITHLLDTSVYSQVLKPRPLPLAIERWDRIGDSSCSVSAVCEAELLFGLEMKQGSSLWRRYEQTLKGRLHVFPVDSTVARSFSKIKAAAIRKGLPADDFDLLIAATAHTHRLVVATLNYRHFAGLESVAVEDWSK